jgi:rod shape-determining protein MreB
MHLYIDLGTSNFRAGASIQKAVLNEPSVVAYGPGQSTIVGGQAEQMLGRHPGEIRLTRPMEGGIVRDYDAVVDVLKYAVSKLHVNRVLRKFSITMSCPGTQSQVDRKALEEAARAVGAGNVHFVEAPIAAAIGAGLPIDKPTGCLVVNLGGGTTEVSLISMGGIVDSQSVNSGGQAIDEEIVDAIRKQYSFVIGTRSAQALKHQVGQPSADNVFKVRGRNLETGLPDTLEVPRQFIEPMLEAYTDKIIQLLIQAIEACPPELVGDIMDHGVILVGGGAYMQRVVNRLTERIEVPVVADDEPDTCVIRGLMKTRTTSRNRSTWKMPQFKQLLRKATPQ